MGWGGVEWGGVSDVDTVLSWMEEGEKVGWFDIVDCG